MRFIYNIGILITGFVLRCIAAFNKKIKHGVDGRSKTFAVLKNKLSKSEPTLWFHCASLGEYEQGLPVFEKLRTHFKNHTIVLSFFSPSGYNIRKNTPIADIVVYLPMDTKKNAQNFLNLVNPYLTVFVKYDIWPNFLNEINKRNLRAILISAGFRKDQIYFKPYGQLFKTALFAFEHIFTQNEESKLLLNAINYNKATVSGDTRFDRVSNQLTIDNSLNFVEQFKGNNLCVVAGSSWPDDDVLLIHYINTHKPKDVKFIIAPHNIKSNQIQTLIAKLDSKVVLYSEIKNKILSNYDVLIIDTIGLLAKIYSYANIAYVGGGMGSTGLHNTLEPAVFGIPIIIGKNYEKFPEAQALIDNGGMFSVENFSQFNDLLHQLIKHSDLCAKYGSKNLEFVNKNRGAVIQILNYLRI